MKEDLFKQLVIQAFGKQHEILLFEDGCLEKFFELAYQAGETNGWYEGYAEGADLREPS